jgi:DNA-binding NarL/FixJ family response regulator
MRLLLGMMLGMEPSIEVAGEAVNGRDALAQCIDLRPDAVVLDMRMPGLTGLQVAEELLSTESAPTVVMCSAYMDDADMAEAKRVGVSACVDKANMSQLAAVLISAHELG